MIGPDPRSGPFAGVGLAESVRREPRHISERRRVRGHALASPRHGRVAQHDGDVGVGENAEQTWQGARNLRRLRRVRRHGDHARVQTAEERGDELEARWIEEQCTLAGDQAVHRERRGDRARLGVELSVRQRFAFYFSVAEESERAVGRAIARTLAEDVDEVVVCHASASSMSGASSSSVNERGSRPVRCISS